VAVHWVVCPRPSTTLVREQSSSVVMCGSDKHPRLYYADHGSVSSSDSALARSFP
jgi:hypothetical protein